MKGKRTYAAPWILFAGKDWTDWGRLADHLRRRGAPSRLGMYEELTVEAARKSAASTRTLARWISMLASRSRCWIRAGIRR